MVWAAAGWAAGLFPRLMRDGAEPGWFGRLNALSDRVGLGRAFGAV